MLPRAPARWVPAVRSGWSHVALLATMIAVAATFELRLSRSFDLVRLALFLPGVVVVHEFGHAGTSALLGHRILEVALGGGPRLRFHIGRTRISLGLLPVGGHVTSGSTERAGFRWKRLAIIAAGPVMNAAMLWVLAALDPTSAALGDFAVVNAFVLITNLLPFSQRTSLGPQPNDGLALVRTLFDPEAELEEHRAAVLVTEAQLLRERGHEDEARTITAAAIERFPQSRIVRTWIGHDLVTSGKYAEARHVYASLVDNDARRIAAPPRGREITAMAVHLNNLAWADLMMNDPELIPEANTASARALELLPGHSAVMGTRALALIATRHYVEGITLAERAFRKERDRRNRAMQACVLAIGHAANWRFADAERWRAIASRLDPGCPLLARAGAELDTRRATTSAPTPDSSDEGGQEPGPVGR
jgi:hypothetical protein